MKVLILNNQKMKRWKLFIDSLNKKNSIIYIYIYVYVYICICICIYMYIYACKKLLDSQKITRNY